MDEYVHYGNGEHDMCRRFVLGWCLAVQLQAGRDGAGSAGIYVPAPENLHNRKNRYVEKSFNK